MRYHVIINDSRDIDSKWGPESALIEDDDIRICANILNAHLTGFADTIYAWRIVDTKLNRVVKEWHK